MGKPSRVVFDLLCPQPPLGPFWPLLVNHAISGETQGMLETLRTKQSPFSRQTSYVRYPLFAITTWEGLQGTTMRQKKRS